MTAPTDRRGIPHPLSCLLLFLIGAALALPLFADPADRAAAAPLGLPMLADPPEAALIDLGRRLFFDLDLSADQTIACGTCHVPEQAFTQNGLATPAGIDGHILRRNAPSLYNVGYRAVLFHDGRETDLQRQIWAPLLTANEMGNESRQAVLERIGADPGYHAAFSALFEDGLTAASLGQALAAYQRALLTADSPFDRWYYGGDFNAMSAAGKRGFTLFNESGCAACHSFSNSHAHFTDDRLHRTGVEFGSIARGARPAGPAQSDAGREEVTGRASDRFRYRTPSLRNVALTAPYMHDGSIATLDAVIQFYAEGGGLDPDRDPGLKALPLTVRQRLDLIAFLESLTSEERPR